MSSKNQISIIGLRKLWFAISIALVVPGVIALFVWRLQPGIDFTGGYEVEIANITNQNLIREKLSDLKLVDLTITTSGEENTLIRYSGSEIIGDDGNKIDPQALKTKLENKITELGTKQVSYSSVGPSVSGDTTRNAIISVLLASIAILLYLSYAFRNTPPPVTSWSFGVTAILAMLHDALFVLGSYAILGKLFGVQVDGLFVTAVLTVIGFSVHDTIVVYDRIREKLNKFGSKFSFEEIVNASIVETLGRSLNTSITVILTLTALLVFGGESIKWFVLALLIGVISGTYSSIFNAAPMLVVWNNYLIKRSKNNAK